jgi:hypothetical protein
MVTIRAPSVILAVLGFSAIAGSLDACTGVIGGLGASSTGAGNGAGGSSGSSSSSSSGSDSQGTGADGGGSSVATSTGGVHLRLLTQAEYLGSVQSLLGTLTTQFSLPSDVSVGGYVSVGAGETAVTDMAVTQYETASLAAVGEVFGNTQRWQTLVGCQPKPDLSDACVTTYIKTFGRSAFRRDLTADEVTQWLGVATNAAMLAGTAAQGLATVTSGFLQSPNFLYRVETNKLDPTSGRLQYDGLSMATRLSYVLTGGPPSPALLNAAAAGQLDTPAGLAAAAAPLLMDASVVDRMTAFFSEYAQVQQVLLVSKSATLFPNFNAALQNSMLQGTELFLKNIVLGPTSDVRAFYDSNQTFVDANLAPIYGVEAPASGFGQVQLPASSVRAGILGQASVIAAQSQPDRTSPTRRGVFILESLLCETPPPPPPGVITTLPDDPTTTTRQQLIAHRANPSCAACHSLFDPLGFGLEHFDPIGQYRATENGLPIDTTGTVDGTAFDGEAQMSSALRQDPKVISCLMRNFYRDANGNVDDGSDPTPIAALVQSLATRNYVWQNLLADFIVSDAFRSAPALPVGSP